MLYLFTYVCVSCVLEGVITLKWSKITPPILADAEIYVC